MGAGGEGDEDNLLDDDSLDRLEHEFVKDRPHHQEEPEFNLLDEEHHP
jgi:hypothetical protein